MNNQDAVQANLALRSILLQTGIRNRKNIGTFVGAIGQTQRIKLLNVGITTSLDLVVTLAVTIAVAIAVPSAKAPWNLINKIKITDYDQTDRIQLSGQQLYILNSVRRRQPFGFLNQPVGGTGIVTNPSTPTAIGNGVIQFYISVPIALNDNQWDGLAQDLTGAIYSQTGVGEFYLTIDWNPTLVSNGVIDAVYAGAGTTTVIVNAGVNAGPQVTVFQNYILPQPVQGMKNLPIPLIDIMSVYELNGNLKTNDNFAINQERLINLPNVRRVLGVYLNFVNNNAYSATDLTLLRYIVNGNNVMKEWTQFAQIVEQRLVCEGDLCAGCYFWSFRDHPIETAIYGNVQLGMTPNALAGVYYAEIGYESVYTKGSALPGQYQAA